MVKAFQEYGSGNQQHLFLVIVLFLNSEKEILHPALFQSPSDNYVSHGMLFISVLLRRECVCVGRQLAVIVLLFIVERLLLALKFWTDKNAVCGSVSFSLIL